MKTIITIEVEHSKPIPHLASMVSGRAWTIDGVTRAEVVSQPVPPLPCDEVAAEEPSQ